MNVIGDFSEESLKSLNKFIVHAKSVTYVGSGQVVPSCRPGSHDLKFSEEEWDYLDSYFGGRDFVGEETVFLKRKPVWAMNYYGHILQPDLITPAQAGEVIKASLSKMYLEGRFLGGFTYPKDEFIYHDASEGEVTSFRGREWISHASEIVYELIYHGGLILDE